jgi:hypothetical protein
MNALELRWIFPAIAILCVEYLVALLIGLKVGFSYEISFRNFAIIGAAVATVGITMAAVWQLFCLWREGEEHPSRRILGRLPWAFGVGVMLVAAQFAVLNWTKVMMPPAVGFWADPALAEIDALLFGQDPWRISHQLFGQFTHLIDRIYGLWAPFYISFLIFLLYLPASTAKAQVMISYFLIKACGALGQYLGASAGPVFYELLDLGDRFRDLPISPWVGVTREYLWNDYLKSGGNLGGGISAMPSMHVAVVLWIALAGRTFLPRLQVIGWAYFAAILIGSVHTGWHYAVDGIVSCAFVLVAWMVASVVANPGWRLSARSRSAVG